MDIKSEPLPTSGPGGPDWMYTLARVFRRTFIAVDDETGDKLCNIEDLVKMIATYAPKDDENCCARLTAFQHVVSEFLQGEIDAGRITRRRG